MFKTFGVGAVLALCLLRVSGKASAPETFTAYSLTVGFSNTVIWTVNGGPASLPGQYPYISPSIILQTDGSGKITGTGWFWFDFQNTPYTAFFVDVTGKIASTATPNQPSVTLTIKGEGYTLDGNGGATLNKINAKFTGSPGPDPYDTNGLVTIVGKLTGKITGTTPLGTNGATLNLDMELPGVTADPAFITTATPLVMSNKVIQSSKRMLIYNYDFNHNSGSNPVFDQVGKGTVNQAKQQYKFSVKGLGPEKGWTLSVAGNLGPYASEVRTNVTFQAPVTATATGKVQGQKISATAGDISAEIITGTADDFAPH